ncbi:hypothetical protein C8R42DRAFT_648710 [Lentinula raphanica]|nr:hypothetical protein C8R42DRAFT_649291 [Lentinula raphanica]KAJ3710592.1 hypothetical protein C8R42DRAFT_648710 [Lentinula raphanica]
MSAYYTVCTPSGYTLFRSRSWSCVKLGLKPCFDVDKQDAATGSGNGLAYLRALQAVNKVTSWYSAAIFLTHHTGKLLGQKHLDVKWFSSLQTTGDFFVCSKEEAAAVLHAITSKKPEPRAVRALRYISRSAVIHTEAALMEYPRRSRSGRSGLRRYQHELLPFMHKPAEESSVPSETLRLLRNRLIEIIRHQDSVRTIPLSTLSSTYNIKFPLNNFPHENDVLRWNI